jgi:hypothetical protein
MSGGGAMSEPIILRATFPLIQSAIKIDGSGGARVQLDVSEECMEQVVALLALRGRVLLVAVQADEDNKPGD